MSKFWNEIVNKTEPYTPGEQPQDKKYIKLNTNENPYPPSQKVIDAMKNAVNDDLKLYPDPLCKNLVNEIADYYNLEPNQIFVGNGSDEILALCFMTFFSESRGVRFPDISYSFYEVYGNYFNIDFKEIPLDDDFNIDLEQFKDNKSGVIFPNPNAPTGKYIDTQKIQEVVESNPDNVVIIDEAYIDFGGESMVQFINKYPNLLVIQTLSKSRSLAGLRGGFALGNKELIEGLNISKNSFNSYTLDRVSLAGAVAAFKDKEDFQLNGNKIIKTREQSVKKLSELGFTVLESKANFIFAKHNSISGLKLYNDLKDKGVLVRHFNKPRITDFLRITIGTDYEMEALINAIKEIV